MVSSRISVLLFTALLTGIPAAAQQAGTSADKTAGTQTGTSKPMLNLTLPVSTENWKSPGDLKTGLEPRPPFLVQTDEYPEFVRELIRLQWRENDPIDVWVTRPKVAGKVLEKPPVILYLYSYDDTDARFRDNDWCKRATAEGYAAVGFVSALTDDRYRNRALRTWFVSELPESLGSTTHDVQLILNFLADRGDIDMNRVGMFGQGSGATIAILAAQADPRIKTIDLLDPWGDWPDWFRTTAILSPEERPKYLTKEFLQSVSTLDPVAYLPQLKTPKVRLQQIAADPITPTDAKARIAAAVPLQTTLVKYGNMQDLFKAWQAAGLSGWIKGQLRLMSAKEPGDDHHVARND